MENQKKIEISGILAGVNLILIGVYLMLAISGTVLFGYLPSMLKLWPVLLIAIGLDLIFRHFEIKYVGSAIVTLLIILVIIASVPGATGSGVRKVFGVPEEPVGWNWDRLAGSWINNLDGMKVVETINQTKPIDFKPTKFKISLEQNVRKLYVNLKSSDVPSCKIKIDILDGIAHYQVKPRELAPPATDGKQEHIFLLDTIESKGKYCDVYVDAAFSPTASVDIDANLVSFIISGDWSGDVNLGTVTHCEVTTGNIGNLAIKGASGKIMTGNCASAAIDTISADVVTGDLAGKSEIVTASGEVTVGKSSQINIKTISGDVKAKEVNGESTINTISGEVTIGIVSGKSNIGLETTSGDIRIESLGQIVSGIIKSTSGQVSVLITKNAGMTINVNTLSGETEIVGMEKMPEPGFDRSFVVGDGTGKLEIGTTSGDVEVRQ